MTGYQQLCDAVVAAREEHFAKRQRCWGYLASILNGLEKHNGVPQDQIDYLKWNGLRGADRLYSIPSDGEYTLPGATDYDKDDGCWHLGVRICFTPKTHFPKQYVTFVLAVSERDGYPVAKIGVNEKLKNVNLTSEPARNLFCDGIMQLALEATQNQNTSHESKTIGFQVIGVDQLEPPTGP